MGLDCRGHARRGRRRHPHRRARAARAALQRRLAERRRTARRCAAENAGAGSADTQVGSTRPTRSCATRSSRWPPRRSRTTASSFLDLAKTSFEKYQQPIAGHAEAGRSSRLGEAERERVAAYSRLTEQVDGARLDGAARCRARCARRRCAAAGAKCSCAASSRSPACCSAATSTSSRRCYGDNGRLRPDLIVHLPGGKQIVVDAKAPLEAFLDAQEATDDDARTVKLQAHARQVRDHMDKLGSKAYWEQLGDSPEMVVMFLPGETLFSAALQHDLTLIEHGLQQRVLLASPITLIALLTTVAHYLAAGGADRELPRGRAARAGSSTSGSRRSPTTSTTCGRSSTARSRPTTRRPARSSRACWSAPGG